MSADAQAFFLPSWRKSSSNVLGTILNISRRGEKKVRFLLIDIGLLFFPVWQDTHTLILRQRILCLADLSEQLRSCRLATQHFSELFCQHTGIVVVRQRPDCASHFKVLGNTTKILLQNQEI